MEELFKNNRYKTILAIFCAFGWSLAYPLIKIGYQEFQIASADPGGKILFAGIRFLFAGMLVSGFCCLRKEKLELKNRNDLWWLILLAIVNTTLHYMFAYIGLGYNPSASSTILESMGGFLLIILSTLLFLMTKYQLRSWVDAHWELRELSRSIYSRVLISLKILHLEGTE